jgi:hypothetical protein
LHAAGDGEGAARLRGAATGLLEQTGAALTAPEQELDRRFLAQIREAAGDDFDRLEAEGRALSPDEAFETALSVTRARETASARR